MEETHYYPFGLLMAGISSKAAGIIQNKEKTFQGQRFDDELGLNLVQFKWRNHDPQIGRFIEIDPLSDKYVYNSTYAFSENKVTAHVELEGLEAADFRIARDIQDVQSGRINNQQLIERLEVRGTADLVAVAAGLVIGKGIALSFAYPAAASVFYASELAGMPLNPSPQAFASTITSDAKSIASTADESTTTLYRGVNESHVKYSDALKGNVPPRGGTASAAEHNAGNTKSNLTSWSKNPEVAVNYALRPKGEGVVLTKTAPTSTIIPSPNTKSINLIQSPGTYVSESEVFLKGMIKGCRIRAMKL